MRGYRPSLSLSLLPLAMAMTLALTACGDDKGAAAAGGGMPPAEVSVVTVQPGKLALTTELPGRLEAMRTAEVRARVAGIVKQRVFKEGSDVKAGDVLFRIDPAPFKAAYDSAAAAVARAEAVRDQTKAQADRAESLIGKKMISQSDYDLSIANAKQAVADVAAAKAAQETARLNLGYATVTAPISGRIGRALVTEGALVGQGEATQLALVQQIDPLYVNFTQSSVEVLKLKRALDSGALKRVDGQAEVALLLEDGSEYKNKGKLLFSDMSVDPSTGSITLRAEFPNPSRLLLPGMYVRVRLEQAVASNAITVPQRALQRNPQGATVMLVGADGKVAAQPVTVGDAQGDYWIITEGLKGGEQVIVEGVQHAQPGAVVKAVPFGAQQEAAKTGAAATPPAAGK
ncbi:MAG: efflux RND transporter periplasmic adaptor subunit [Pedobacter sp.]|nr:efflux RND transporter periplasmic adaptor subunit [Pedobacter sp.]